MQTTLRLPVVYRKIFEFQGDQCYRQQFEDSQQNPQWFQIILRILLNFSIIFVKKYMEMKEKVDKVVVNVHTDDEPLPVLLNRNISTSYHAFNHLSKHVADNAVLVDVQPNIGGSYTSCVNQPLQDQATIRKIDFDSSEFVNLLNDAYWRSCALVTAAILKESLDVNLEFTIPNIDVSSGFFHVDVEGLNGNALSRDELNTINRYAKSFIKNAKDFEVVSIPSDLSDEVPSNYIVRIGDHVFPSSGLVIRSTSQIGRYSILHSKSSGIETVSVGGVSLPFSQPTSSYSWGLIVKNALTKYQKSSSS
ncbi:unnamed protein product [Caenorhabditis angaria]|uniref:Uncharacterized protein n=1 Tax=Caenorhabditis angaria TaxID=860376 RepID=A0A9P1IS36_9PELO|nr:unnamed protein product [Caenorhabditis angaria]